MPLDGLQLGHYRLQRLIGSGGMGEVYLAEDLNIQRQVAIKVISAEVTPYPDASAVREAARLFQREATAIAMLDHPNILPLYDYGEEKIQNSLRTYLVTPFRQEGSLAAWLQRREKADLLAPRDVTHIVRQAAAALQYAHDHHVVHQDVKPSNFLIRGNPSSPNRPDVLLADFGVAKLSSATSSASQSIRGTPTYMAPEQWTGEAVPATDQYALAVMAYELLVGRPPFQGSPMRMMYMHANESPPPPSALNPRLSAGIDAVLLQALAKKPEERFASVDAFARAFEQAAQGMEDAPAAMHTASKPESNDIRATLAISKEEARQGTSRTLTLPGGRRINVAIPPGASNGQVIRLEGQSGSPGQAGAAGSLILTLAVADPEEEAATLRANLGPGKTSITSAPTYQSNPGGVDSQAATRQTAWNAIPPPTNAPATPAFGQGGPTLGNPPTPLSAGPSAASLPTQAQEKLILQSQSLPAAGYGGNTGIPPSPMPYQAPPPATPPRRRRSSGVRITLLVVLVLLVIGASASAFYYFSNNQGTGTGGGPGASASATSQSLTATSSSQSNDSATSTAVAQVNANNTATAEANTNQTNTSATATAQANATAEANAQANATATAIALQHPYGGTLAWSDPMSDNSGGHSWAETSGCQFSGGAYHVVAVANYGNVCHGQNTNFSNFAIQARMSFASSGQHFSGMGIVFRSDGNYNEYELNIYERGSYDITVCRYTNPGADCSHALAQGTIANWNTGLNNPNTVAIVANGGDISLYVNGQRIAHATDATYTQGQVGFLSDGGDGTTDVVVSNVKIWTF